MTGMIAQFLAWPTLGVALLCSVSRRALYCN